MSFIKHGSAQDQRVDPEDDPGSGQGLRKSSLRYSSEAQQPPSNLADQLSDEAESNQDPTD